MNQPASQYTLQQKVFLLLLTIVTIGFFWILMPYSGAVFWGIVLAILFIPLYRRLLRATNRNRIFRPAHAAVHRGDGDHSGGPDQRVAGAAGGRHLRHDQDRPHRLRPLLQPDHRRVAGLGGRPAGALRPHQHGVPAAKLTSTASEASQVAAKYAINFASNTFDFLVSMTIMLYLLFFLLRDGHSLAGRIKTAVPLSRKYKQRLFSNFTTVIRATVKGNVLVAIAQGALGGLIFWILNVQAPMLWAVVMAFLSLLPAVGAAIVWAPVAVYFLVTGSVWQGVVLIAFGVFVIGLVDNFLRPVLVGKDTKMPDYVVLLSTVGGMACSA
jgi:predicted PurR-regulated permease PerM